MTLPDRLTFIRVILTPVFFVVYMLPVLFPEQLAGSAVWAVPALWLIFIVSELTDLFDGIAARRLGLTSDFGKLFDPFADTLMQITCFFCFVIDGIFPAVLFLLVLYREFSILFIRNLMLKKGVAMGARIGGKIKTVTHIAAAAIALLYASLSRLGVFSGMQPFVKISAIAVFGVSVLFSVLSFMDYLTVYLNAGKTGPS
ncbi:MAG: CDP-diacylglycerol--glycerol-3-phosphate 3-phosphatidyltransferase [Treponema sp.]|nr:CDP-diacylglycerol--glycerol-3-phosphate 3-phosphatidyltransferase [Treponema sp.]MCL2127672.1 CDP-diacylglycerol--glycerol-3-phosphate 3-phosphatidyltransferase [Treponema sp.]